MSTLATFNGVDTSRIAALSNTIQEEPAQCDTVWKAELIWQNGFRNQIRIRDLPASYADEPEVLGGTNTAPNPVEQLLGALGSCLAIFFFQAEAGIRDLTVTGVQTCALPI